jgi:hypothetical protein
MMGFAACSGNEKSHPAPWILGQKTKKSVQPQQQLSS